MWTFLSFNLCARAGGGGGGERRGMNASYVSGDLFSFTRFLYGSWRIWNEEKGRDEKALASTLQYENFFFAVIIYDESSLTAVAVLCDSELLSFPFFWVTQKNFLPLFLVCIFCIQSRNSQSQCIIWQMWNVRLPLVFPFFSSWEAADGHVEKIPRFLSRL